MVIGAPARPRQGRPLQLIAAATPLAWGHPPDPGPDPKRLNPHR
jgi:hypothetical protein